MKKVVSLILICMIVMSISIIAFATDSVLGNEANNNPTTITGNEYENAQQNNNNSTLPQTGVDNYKVGILLAICIAGAIFAYKKVSDYRDI